MSETMEIPLDSNEKSIWKYLLKEFPIEILAIVGSLMALAECLSLLFRTQPLFDRKDLVEQLQKADNDDKRSCLWTMLLYESLERLYSARLLLFTGHQSRCLSCVRDAFECLRKSDV